MSVERDIKQYHLSIHPCPRNVCCGINALEMFGFTVGDTGQAWLPAKSSSDDISWLFSYQKNQLPASVGNLCVDSHDMPDINHL